MDGVDKAGVKRKLYIWVLHKYKKSYPYLRVMNMKTVDNVVLSLASLNINERLKTDITPSDLNMICFIGKNKLTQEEISKKLNMDEELVKFLLNRLKRRDLATTNSPQWILTNEGKKVVREFNAIYDKIINTIKNDTYLNEISEMSRNHEL